MACAKQNQGGRDRKQWRWAAVGSLFLHLALVMSIAVPEPPVAPQEPPMRIRLAALTPKAVVDSPAKSTPPKSTPARSTSKSVKSTPKSAVAKSTSESVKSAPKSAGAKSTSESVKSAPKSAGAKSTSESVKSAPKSTPAKATSESTKSTPTRRWATAEEARVQKKPSLNLDVASVPTNPLVKAPKRPVEREQLNLQPMAGGGYVVREESFDAYIARDGTIEFDDGLPIGLQPDGFGLGGADERARSARQGALRDPVMRDWGSTIGLTMKFELNDMIIRAVGDDPYGAQKRKIAKMTAPLRARLAEEACRERLTQSFIALGPRLRRIWEDKRRSAEARRARLFSVWDGCIEEGDPDRVLHGHMVRTSVIAFVQANLPKGSAMAYTARELDALNRRRQSRLEFQPYLN